MTRMFLWRTVAGIVCFLVVVLGSLTLIPELLYPSLTDAQLSGVTGADTQIQLQQAQSQLQNNARSSLLQAIAGLLLVAGAVGTWRQVQVNREGQLTERFTRAVDQLGSENTDIRIGGIYTLRLRRQTFSRSRRMGRVVAVCDDRACASGRVWGRYAGLGGHGQCWHPWPAQRCLA
jgi:hypothetical protein